METIPQSVNQETQHPIMGRIEVTIYANVRGNLLPNKQN